MKSKQMELDIFPTPINVVAAAAPSKFQHKIIEHQTNDTLNGIYFNTPLVECYQRYVTAGDFPTLRKHALKYVSLFGSTYYCEQFFSKLNLAKSRFRSRKSNENLGQQLPSSEEREGVTTTTTTVENICAV